MAQGRLGLNNDVTGVSGGDAAVGGESNRLHPALISDGWNGDRIYHIYMRRLSDIASELVDTDGHPPPAGYDGVYNPRRRRRQCAVGLAVSIAIVAATWLFRRKRIAHTNNAHAGNAHAKNAHAGNAHADSPFVVDHDCMLQFRAHSRDISFDCYMQASLAEDRRFIRRIHRNKTLQLSERTASRNFPLLRRWHLTTQDKLFGHLRAIWADDKPRVMADLGCHAGHGKSWNTSDALLWLDFFNHSGSLIFAVDVFEDFTTDLQRKFDDAPPYNSLSGVTKRALTLAVSPDDSQSLDLGRVATGHVASCAADWVAGFEAKYGFPNHVCSITRRALRIAPGEKIGARSADALAAVSDTFAQRALDTYAAAKPPPAYPVPAERLDTMWAQRMSRRHSTIARLPTQQRRSPCLYSHCFLQACLL